ncbi:MAG: hypothetical protein ICV83_08090 [Cytophagales bacterium]|nr:hypothetical protein [Cytophagales bacterium]
MKRVFLNRAFFFGALLQFSCLAGLLLPVGLLSSCRETVDCGCAAPPAPVEQGPRLKRITWADTDFQEYTYDANGLLSKYVSQWLFVMGTDQVKRVESTFEYNRQGQITRMVTEDVMEVKYYYKGGVLEKSEEYDQKGRLAVTHYYVFSHGHQPLEIRDVITDPTEGNRVTGELKHVYEYDGKGNNTVRKEYVKDLNTGEFTLNLSMHFEGFDANKCVENATALNPYVPHARLWTNNYTSRTLKDKNGKVLQPPQLYTFECNAQGYPVRKTMGSANVTLRATVAYE